MEKNYFLGLDLGTSSVGWAVTDEKYHLKRAKGKTLWGARLFDEASTAADRRVHRSARRRLDRANNRLKLLRLLFRDEIQKVDPDFYLRMDESFYRNEDKRGVNSDDTLFNDPDFHDKELHNKYPTIWHLRAKILAAGSDEHFDIREYFLAIQHILKHRGHFLIEGELKGNAGNFQEIYDEFYNAARNAGFFVRDDMAEKVEKIICDKKTGKMDKKKALKELIYDEDLGADQDSDEARDYVSLAGLLVGSKVDFNKLFGVESSEKKSYSFSDMVFEEKVGEIEEFLSDDAAMDVVFAAKKIYDYGVLKNLLGDSKSVSAAMVKNYDLHKRDLEILKKILRSDKKTYDYFFKSEIMEEKKPNYAAYVGKAFSKEDKNGRKKTASANQEDLNAAIKKLLEGVNLAEYIKDTAEREEFSRRLENGELLPKQRGQAKGTIPQQLHHNELMKILEKLGEDFPSFKKTVADEPEEYNDKLKKIAKIHEFRIPYYCGPIKRKAKDENDKTGSQFSWADEEIREIVYPWNFEKLVNLDARAEKFIERMTNECTYLFGENVLPKASLLYQKYMVLNEINNLKINGRRLEDHELKLKIFENFEKGFISGNVTARSLEKFLKENGIIASSDELSGTSEAKYLPKLSTFQDMRRTLGDDFAKKYSGEQLEEIVKAITILGDEKKMLKHRLAKILNLSEGTDKNGEKTVPENDARVEKLAKLNYKDWGRFSAKFLNGLQAKVGAREMTILEALYETENNLMELLGGNRDFHFGEMVEEYNKNKKPEKHELNYEDVKELYCSPAVKRSVWQAARIVKELTEVLGQAPKRIFLEATRGEDKEKKGVTLSRKKQLEEKLSAAKSPDAKALLAELKSREDRDLQSKKLFLYFSQMGKCAYSGERIDLERLMTNAYDIDHIYPRSLTKDDSITRNLVLVKAELNREKTNTYPISENIRNRMRGTWAMLAQAGLITKEKFERLNRATPLTDEELAGFISRQIVETSQAVKAIRDLFKEAYPETQVVLVKAGQVSALRQLYGYDKKDREGNVIKAGRPEFVKVRDLNDFHHAKDAYLNIVVGNTMWETFTGDPFKWIRARNEGTEHQYSIRPERLFRDSETYEREKWRKNEDGSFEFEKKYTTKQPQMKGWNYGESLEIVSAALKRNDVLWTRMAYEQSGQISDLQVVGKLPEEKIAKNPVAEGLLPIKDSERLKETAKYGGYNSLKGAYAALIETEQGNKTIRKLVWVPIINKRNSTEYLLNTYPNCKILIPKIYKWTKITIDSFPLFLLNKDSETVNGICGAVQIFLDNDDLPYLKNIINVATKFKNKEYTKPEDVNEEKDGVSNATCLKEFDAVTRKMGKFLRKMPEFGGKVDMIIKARTTFEKLNLADKCIVIGRLINAISCNATVDDLSLIIPYKKKLGTGRVSSNITGKDVKLIHQSVTGLFEREIDLNKIQPKKEN